MNKVLVTGARGFVGGEVVGHMLDLGKEVTGLGRTVPEGKIAFIKADLADAETLEKALSGQSFDTIMHLASLPGDSGDPRQMIRVNINGLLNILEFARNSKVKRFVLASSISAYEWYPATNFNPPDYMPVDEKHPCRPKDMYSTTKRMQELLALTYYKQYELPVVVLRLTAVVGPRGKGGGRGWYEFAKKLAGGKRVQIPHFSADEMCHYVDIRDVARMFAAAAEHPKAVGEIFNCCGPKPIRGREFAEIINCIVPDILVEYNFPWSMAQGGEIAFDIYKAEKLIEFKPIYTMADSIKNIKEWINAGGFKKESRTDKDSYGEGIEKD